MKRASWILALAFGLVLVGASLLNATLIGKARGALAGTASGSRAEAARFHLVVIVPEADDSFFQGLLEGVGEAAEGYGAAVQVFRYPGQSPEESDRYFGIAVRAKVDGIVAYSPRGGGQAAGRAAEAARRGVVYVPIGTDAPPGESGPFIGSGSLQQGFEGGRLIGGGLGAKARVGLLIAPAGKGGYAAEPLYAGLAAALRAFPGAEVSAVAESAGGMLSGEAVAEAMLRSHPGVNAILCATARDTVGAAQVVIDRGLVGRILIVGAGETPDIRRYIDKGVLAASIVRDSRRIGLEAVRTFSLIKAGGKAPGPSEAGFFVVGGRGGR